MKKLITCIFTLLIAHITLAQQLIDGAATRQTKNLYRNLFKLSGKAVLLGQQDALAYGVNWKYVDGKCDMKEVAGDYPAVLGWDLGHIENGSAVNLDSVPFEKMRAYILETYNRGGVNTISWHGNNPVNDSSAWNTAPGTVKSILPGGAYHEKFITWLDKIATFLESLKNNDGEYIPVLFRPFHELTGDWFWWGTKSSGAEEFKELFRFTVMYLRDVKQLHHLIYVYNTSQTPNKESFLERYPGDAYVDVLSFDAYQYVDPSKDDSFTKSVHKNLQEVYELASRKQKLLALAETGYERIPYEKWWTHSLWPAIKDIPLSYILLWRNAGWRPHEKNMHYYVPFKGDVSAGDFKSFCEKPGVYLSTDALKEGLYQ